MVTMDRAYNRINWQFCWFGVFGLANTIGYFGVFYAVHEWLMLPRYLSILAAYSTSVLISFLGNSRVTFRDSKLRFSRRVAIFMLIYLLGVVYNIMCVNGLGMVFGLDVYPPLLFFILSWPAISFSLNKYFLFNDKLTPK